MAEPRTSLALTVNVTWREGNVNITGLVADTLRTMRCQRSRTRLHDHQPGSVNGKETPFDHERGARRVS